MECSAGGPPARRGRPARSRPRHTVQVALLRTLGRGLLRPDDGAGLEVERKDRIARGCGGMRIIVAACHIENAAGLIDRRRGPDAGARRAEGGRPDRGSAPSCSGRPRGRSSTPPNRHGRAPRSRCRGRCSRHIPDRYEYATVGLWGDPELDSHGGAGMAVVITTRSPTGTTGTPPTRTPRRPEA